MNFLDVEKELADTLIQEKKSAKEDRLSRAEYLQKHRKDFMKVLVALDKLATEKWLKSVSVCGNSIDLDFSGDKHALKLIFHKLRDAGYKPDDRPTDENISNHSTYWRKEGVEFKMYIRFASTTCRRVKIGTKLVEQDVYETVCD